MKGDTGNFLYAGNFRYYEGLLNVPDLQKYYSGDDALDVLFLDPLLMLTDHPLFPSKFDVLQDILDCVRQLPHHYLIFLTPHFGKEELFVAISLELEELVYISPQRHKILQYANLSHFFTDSLEESRLWVLNFKDFRNTDLNCLDAPYRLVLLTEDPILNFDESQFENEVHHYPYHPYSSRDELVFFVSALKPLRLKRTTQVDKPINQNYALARELKESQSFTKPPDCHRKRKRANDSSQSDKIQRTGKKHPCPNFEGDFELVAENYQQFCAESLGLDLPRKESNNCENNHLEESDKSDKSDTCSYWSCFTGYDVSKLHLLRTAVCSKTFMKE